MPIPVQCDCGKKISAPDSSAGKTAKCPACGKPLLIPPERSAASAPSSAAAARPVGKKSAAAAAASRVETVSVTCACGKTLKAKASLMGKAVKCPACGKGVKIGSASQRAPVPKAAAGRTAAKRGGVLDELFDDAGISGHDPGAKRRCPECKCPMDEEAIICIQCGYNEKTGKKLKTYRPLTADDRAARAEARSPMMRSSGEKGDSSRPAGASGRSSLVKVGAFAGLIVAIVVGGYFLRNLWLR
jgi:ssDNA-binding Zn-finger/Zn-ribbon topoisomerase 1